MTIDQRLLGKMPRNKITRTNVSQLIYYIFAGYLLFKIFERVYQPIDSHRRNGNHSATHFVLASGPKVHGSKRSSRAYYKLFTQASMPTQHLHVMTDFWHSLQLRVWREMLINSDHYCANSICLAELE